MKIENKINKLQLKEALIRWVLGTDGQNGKTCALISVIPWGDEINSVISWDDVCDYINDSFGSRLDENGKMWDIGVILTNSKEYFRFDKFITLKIKNVMDVYQVIIDKANSVCNTKFEIIVYKFDGVVNNVAKYVPIYSYFNNSLTSLANHVYDKLKVSDWEKDDFIDAVHYGLYNNSSTAFKSSFITDSILHLEVKKNHLE